MAEVACDICGQPAYVPDDVVRPGVTVYALCEGDARWFAADMAAAFEGWPTDG